MDIQKDHTVLTHRLLQIVLLMAISWAVYEAVTYLMPVVAPVMVAFFLAYLMAPFVDLLENRGLPRWLGFVILMMVLLVFLLFVILVIIPLISEELGGFVSAVPGYISSMRARVLPWLSDMLGQRVPDATNVADMLMKRIQSDLTSILGHAYSPLKHMAFLAAAGTYFIISLLVTLIIVPFFTYYIIEGYPVLSRFPYMVIPKRYHSAMEAFLKELHVLLSSWFRGQITVMLVLGVLYSIGYSIISLPLAMLVGLLTGFLAFIPYVGAIVGFLLALVLALMKGGIWPVVGVLGVFTVVQTLDALFVTPKILGRSIEMNPAGVVFVLMFFGYLWGFWGALVAVPVSAVIKVSVQHLLQAYHRTRFYGSEV